MLCPHCKKKLKCVDTVHIDDKGRTLRKYACRDCNLFFYTKEDILDDRDMEFFTDWYKWWRYKPNKTHKKSPISFTALDAKVEEIFK